MLKPWRNAHASSTTWITDQRGVKYVWLEMSTIREALCRGDVAKVTLHTEYGRVVFYNTEGPFSEGESDGWIFDEREKFVVRCRVSWYTYQSTRIEVYGEAQ